jgi:Cation transport ATPase
MIEIAAILSASVHHWEDFWIIMTMLLINAGVGFWQEYKADNAIELLKKKLALKARVKRDGKWILLAAEGIVPGDLVRVRLGEIIPADIKLMIAYDNTNIYQDPVSWNMRRVLSLATVLGIMGVFASFLMFWIGERVLHLDRVTIQTLIFLKLTVVGHMTIYLARIGEELFWIRPYPSPPYSGLPKQHKL